MPKKEKKRMFESEILILPALKMILTEDDKDAKGKSAKKKVNKDFNEETVMRIIGKLSMKE